MKLRTKRRRKTPFWAMRAVASQRRDPHNYDFSGCQAVSCSCNLKGAPKKHARCGGTSGVALICLAARLGFSFPKEKRFWNLGGSPCRPQTVPDLGRMCSPPAQGRSPALWALAWTLLCLGFAFPAPSLTFFSTNWVSGALHGTAIFPVQSSCGVFFPMARKTAGLPALGWGFYAGKGGKNPTDEIVNDLFMFKVMVLSSLLSCNL